MKRKFLTKVISLLIGFTMLGSVVANADTIPSNGWYNDGNNWVYYNNNIKQKGWLYNNNKWYYFYGDGTLATGIIENNGDTYHTDLSGALIKGWIKEWDMWYHFGNDYLMNKGWNKIDGIWYYFYNDGSMAYNTVIDGYYLDDTGKISTKPKNKMTYEDAVSKGIKTIFGDYAHVTPVKFERAPVKQGDFTFDGLVAQEDKNHGSRELLFSTKPLSKETAIDFDLSSSDKWIVASATLQNDGSYRIIGQYYFVRLGMGRGKITYDPEAKSQADDDSYISIYPDGSVDVRGQIVNF